MCCRCASRPAVLLLTTGLPVCAGRRGNIHRHADAGQHGSVPPGLPVRRLGRGSCSYSRSHGSCGCCVLWGNTGSSAAFLQPRDGCNNGWRGRDCGSGDAGENGLCLAVRALGQGSVGARAPIPDNVLTSFRGKLFWVTWAQCGSASLCCLLSAAVEASRLCSLTYISNTCAHCTTCFSGHCHCVRRVPVHDVCCLSLCTVSPGICAC